MHVRAEPRVIRQVKPIVVGVVVEHDVVVVPEPIADKRRIRGSDLEVETAHAEPIAIASAKPPNVLCANRLCEVSVVPWAIQVVARVGASRRVSDPLVIVCVHMRCFWMSGLVSPHGRCRGGGRTSGSGLTNRRGAVLRNVSAADALFPIGRRGRASGFSASLLRSGDKRRAGRTHQEPDERRQHESSLNGSSGHDWQLKYRLRPAQERILQTGGMGYLRHATIWRISMSPRCSASPPTIHPRFSSAVTVPGGHVDETASVRLK